MFGCLLTDRCLFVFAFLLFLTLGCIDTRGGEEVVVVASFILLICTCKNSWNFCVLLYLYLYIPVSACLSELLYICACALCLSGSFCLSILNEEVYFECLCRACHLHLSRRMMEGTDRRWSSLSTLSLYMKKKFQAKRIYIVYLSTYLQCICLFSLRRGGKQELQA